MEKQAVEVKIIYRARIPIVYGGKRNEEFTQGIINRMKEHYSTENYHYGYLCINHKPEDQPRMRHLLTKSTGIEWLIN